MKSGIAFLMAVWAVGFCSAVHAQMKPAVQPAASQPAIVLEQNKSTIFVMDCSGSMIRLFKPIKYEVKTAVQNLPDGHKFNIFMAGDEVKSFSAELAVADEKTRQAACDFIEAGAKPRGPSSLEKAITAAAELHPEVLWLLTDGDFGVKTQDAQTAAIKDAATKNNVKIYATQKFLADRKFYKSIASLCYETGGKLFNPKGIDVAKKLAEAPEPKTVK